MLVVVHPILSIPEQNISTFFPTTLGLFGTLQFIEAFQSNYEDFNHYDLRVAAKMILQRQAYLFFTWNLTKYIMANPAIHDSTNPEFFKLTPDSFQPEIFEIEAYLSSPGFLWRMSNANYKKLCDIFNLTQQNEVYDLGIVTVHNDVSAIAPILASSGNGFKPFNYNLVKIFFENTFTFELSKYELTEFMFSYDYDLHSMDSKIDYADFVLLLLTGRCNNSVTGLFLTNFKTINKVSYKIPKKSNRKMFNKKEINLIHSLTPIRMIEEKPDSILENLLKSVNSDSFKRNILKSGTNDDVCNIIFGPENKPIIESYPVESTSVSKYFNSTETSKSLTFNAFKSVIEKQRDTKKFQDSVPKNSYELYSTTKKHPIHYIIPYIKELVRKSRVQNPITHALYKNSNWAHDGFMAMNEHPFSFYNFIISWFGYSVNVNNFKVKNHKNQSIRKPYKCFYNNESIFILIDEYLNCFERDGRLWHYSSRYYGDSINNWLKIKADIYEVYRSYTVVRETKNKKENKKDKNNNNSDDDIAGDEHTDDQNADDVGFSNNKDFDKKASNDEIKQEIKKEISKMQNNYETNIDMNVDESILGQKGTRRSNEDSNSNNISDLCDLFEYVGEDCIRTVGETIKSNGTTYYTANSTVRPLDNGGIDQAQEIPSVDCEVISNDESNIVLEHDVVEADTNKSSIGSSIFKKFGNSLRIMNRSSIKKLNIVNRELEEGEYFKIKRLKQTKPISKFSRIIKGYFISV